MFSTAAVNISAIAAAVPKQRIENANYTLLSEAERAFLIKTTGIKERRMAETTQTSSDLCYAAATQLLNKRKIDKQDIGLLIFVSQSNDYFLPATATTLQHRLGLSQATMAFDIGLGCSGYVYGLTIANSLMQTLGINKALLLAGDVSSTTCSADDKSSYPLFGDAGTATLLERNNQAAVWHGNLMSDGSGADAIMITHGMSRNKPTPQSFELQDIAPGIRRAPLHLALKGEEIFAFSIKEVPSSVNSLMAHANGQLDNIDFLIMHQANRLINETIRKKLKIPAEKVPYSLDEFGNTSSASIPLTLVTRLADRLTSPQRLLLSGFGVGLSWGNLLIESDSIHCLPLLEI